MNNRKQTINELRFQLDSKEVKDQHYPVQLSASDANAILALLKEQEPVVPTWWRGSHCVATADNVYIAVITAVHIAGGR